MKTSLFNTLLISLLFFSFTAQAQIITTIAGGNTVLGDGGPATNAGIDGPYDVALDGKGNFYITDGYHNRIRKVDTAGIITTIAGNDTEGYNGDGIAATAAQLNRPIGLVIDRHGNIYFSDAFNNRVRRIDTFGIITTVAGNGNTIYNGDNIAADSAAIWDPRFLALDDTGNLYIAEYEGHRIRKVSPLGIVTSVAGTGVAGYTGDGGLATDAQINMPYGIVLDGSNIIFSDASENVVRRVDTSGNITTIAGKYGATALGDGGPADSAMLNGPIGVKLDVFGNLYIADGHHNRIRRVDRNSPSITTIAGNGTLGFSGDNGPATNAEFRLPAGLAIDASGNIYIADFGNQRIRFIKDGAVAIRSPDVVTLSLSLYPNPSTGSFTCLVQAKENVPLQYTITDVLGAVVVAAHGVTNSLMPFRIDVPSGIYYLRCATQQSVANSILSIDR